MFFLWFVFVLAMHLYIIEDIYTHKHIYIKTVWSNALSISEFCNISFLCLSLSNSADRAGSIHCVSDKEAARTRRFSEENMTTCEHTCYFKFFKSQHVSPQVSLWQASERRGGVSGLVYFSHALSAQVSATCHRGADAILCFSATLP